MQFVNVESGEPCQPMEKGEMRFKTNTMSMGYLNQPKSALFDEEGYIKSGDIGYYDAAGTVYYVERHKEVIKYGRPYQSLSSPLFLRFFFFVTDIATTTSLPQRSKMYCKLIRMSWKP